MNRQWPIASALLVLVLSLVASLPSLAAESGPKTPEDAVAAYLEGVAHRDFAAILAATAVEEMSAGFDFVAFVDRLRSLNAMAPAPGADPLYLEINRAAFTAQIARQVQFLAYGLLTSTPITEGRTAPMDRTGAEQFARAVDAAQLAGIALVAVAVPKPAVINSERYRANAVKIAGVYGADESTERLALVRLVGRHYAIGFTLLRFGETWKVSSQSSPVAGTNALGAPIPSSPEDFAEAVK